MEMNDFVRSLRSVYTDLFSFHFFASGVLRLKYFLNLTKEAVALVLNNHDFANQRYYYRNYYYFIRHLAEWRANSCLLKIFN